MKNLLAFDVPWPQVSLVGHFQNQGHRFKLKFELKDPLSLIQKSEKFFQKTADEESRRDNLWKSTCFELFLKVPGTTRYYEFNFSSEGQWNIYEFTDYRKPQPPLRSQDFTIEEWSWRSSCLEVAIVNRTAHLDWEISLTSVLSKEPGQVQYWALRHESDKPDFHQFETFILVKNGDSL